MAPWRSGYAEVCKTFYTGSIPVGASIFNISRMVNLGNLCYYRRMGRERSWTDEELRSAVETSKSYRAVLIKLRLIPAGGNYAQIQRRIKTLNLNIEHFTGMGWNAGLSYETKNLPPIESLLVLDSFTQSYKLKKRLFKAGLKTQKCELCGWAEQAADGRVPVELDHINGDHNDNRLENLRILCPNCHSLQATHRGKNKKVHLRYARVV